ncbi:MAG: short chain dehydrogenase [Sneathiella sp.]|nr:MAG: short chain dehydrogenase [Sneathiella sp.]
MSEKNILITGAARRIGRTLALCFAKAGWNIALHYGTSHDDAASLADEIAALGVKTALVPADLMDAEAVQKIVPAAVAALGPLHCLINNAAFFEWDDIHTVTADSFSAHLNVNLQAPLLLSQSFARQVPKGTQGNIINIVDQRVFNLGPEFLSYTLSKSGLWTLTQTLAMALAPAVRVNAIGPGPTLANTRQTAAQFRQQQQSVPLGYGPTADEIASAALFILQARSMTGEFIALDGGQHLPIIGKGEDVHE